MGIFFLPMLALVSLSGSAWSENIGWVNFSGPGYRATMDGDTGAFGGWAWSDQVGWIKLAGDAGTACAATEGGDCSNAIGANAGEWDGLIRFAGTGYGSSVTGTEETGCRLTGYGWGANVVGWLHMEGAHYGVKLEKCIVPVKPPRTQSLSCSFNAGPKVLISPQRTTRLTWTCEDADSCTILPPLTDKGIISAVSGALTAAPPHTTTYVLKCGNESGQSVEIPKIVTVIKSQLCEVNPADPSCE